MRGLGRLALALALACGAVVAAGGPVLAYDQWCDGDPVVTAVTPGGNQVQVDNNIFVQQQNKDLLAQVSIQVSTEPAGPGRSEIEVVITLPPGPAGGLALVHVTVSRYHVSRWVGVRWGRQAEVDFLVPVS